MRSVRLEEYEENRNYLGECEHVLPADNCFQLSDILAIITLLVLRVTHRNGPEPSLSRLK